MMRNYAEVLVDGDRILSRLLDDLRSARRDIHVSVFLFFRDPIGEEVAAVLEERARAGVTVRVLLNIEKTAMGDPFSTGEKRMMRHDPNVTYDPLDVGPLCDRMRGAGVRVIDSDIDYDKEVHASDPRLRSIAAQIRGAIDVDALHIDHRKIIIVDGCVAYCGGANVGAQYMFHTPFDPARHAAEEAASRAEAGDREPWWKWHDSLTRFVGLIAEKVDAEFRARWILDGGDDYAEVAPLPPLSQEGIAVASATVYTNAPMISPTRCANSTCASSRRRSTPSSSRTRTSITRRWWRRFASRSRRDRTCGSC